MLKNNLNLITRYPLVNSRLEGTEVRQLYPIYKFIHNLREGYHEIILVTDSDISTTSQISGSINWLSNYLVDLGHQTTFISEEPILINKITKLNRENHYSLSLITPLRNSYILYFCSLY